MRKIRLNDGTEYGIDRCGAEDNVLWIRVTSTDNIYELIFTFADAEKTAVITEFWTDESLPPTVYEGYTAGKTFQRQDGGILIGLEKGEG